jgi:hypothetical protein
VDVEQRIVHVDHSPGIHMHFRDLAGSDFADPPAALLLDHLQVVAGLRLLIDALQEFLDGVKAFSRLRTASDEALEEPTAGLVVEVAGLGVVPGEDHVVDLPGVGPRVCGVQLVVQAGQLVLAHRDLLDLEQLQALLHVDLHVLPEVHVLEVVDNNQFPALLLGVADIREREDGLLLVVGHAGHDEQQHVAEPQQEGVDQLLDLLGAVQRVLGAGRLELSLRVEIAEALLAAGILYADPPRVVGLALRVGPAQHLVQQVGFPRVLCPHDAHLLAHLLRGHAQGLLDYDVLAGQVVAPVDVYLHVVKVLYFRTRLVVLRLQLVALLDQQAHQIGDHFHLAALVEQLLLYFRVVGLAQDLLDVFEQFLDKCNLILDLVQFFLEVLVLLHHEGAAAGVLLAGVA